MVHTVKCHSPEISVGKRDQISQSTMHINVLTTSYSRRRSSAMESRTVRTVPLLTLSSPIPLSPISAYLLSPPIPLLFRFSIVLQKPSPDWLATSIVLQVAPLSIVLLWRHSLLFSIVLYCSPTGTATPQQYISPWADSMYPQT